MDCAAPATPVSPGSKPASSKQLNPNLCPKNRVRYTLTKRVWVLLAFFLAGRSGDKTGIDYIDSTPLPVCHNRRIAKHKVFEGLAERGKTSMGWFFGFKLHLVFNHMREIVAVKLTPGNVSDTAVVPELTKDLM